MTSPDCRRSSLLLPGHLGRVPGRGPEDTEVKASAERCAQTVAAATASFSPDEGLECSALRVDAQRHTLPLLVLRDEAMDKL